MNHVLEVNTVMDIVLFPVVYALWLTPWVVIAVWIDRGRPKQFYISTLMLMTVLVALEMTAIRWFGPAKILSGIPAVGAVVFLPTMLVLLIRRRRLANMKKKRMRTARPASAASTGTPEAGQEVFETSNPETAEDANIDSGG